MVCPDHGFLNNGFGSLNTEFCWFFLKFMSQSNCTEHVTASQCKLSPKKRSEQMFRFMKQLVQNNTDVDDKNGILVEKIIFCEEQKILSKCKNFEF